MKITFHIGHEKTGSTSIQRYLAQNFSKPGEPIYYPRSGRLEKGDEHRYIFKILAEGQPRILTDVVAHELDIVKCENAIISCEMFSALQGPANQALELFLETAGQLGWEVEIVCFVRKARPFLRSLYMEGLKWGTEEAFADFVRGHLPRLCDGQLKDIADRHGVVAHFLPYQREGLLETFMKLVDPDIAMSEPAEPLELNRRVPEWMAPFLLIANQTFRTPDFTRESMLAALRVEAEPPEWFDPESYFALPKDLSQEIAEIEATDKVRSRLFG